MEELFERLARSQFRSKFHLSEKDKQYVVEKGLSKIREHAFVFVRTRLAVKPSNDGKQTPYRGHPVFISQHATATCCRVCIEKWHKIPAAKDLNERQIHYIVDVIMKFIEKEMEVKKTN